MAKKKKPMDEYFDETGTLVGAGVTLGVGSAAVGALGAGSIAPAFGTAAKFLPVFAGLSAAKLAIKDATLISERLSDDFTCHIR